MLYNPSLSAWTKINVGLVTTVKPQGRLFLKSLDVDDDECKDFDMHLNLGKVKAIPHIRNDLPGQRSEVRRKYAARKSFATPTPTRRTTATPTLTPGSVISISDSESSDELPTPSHAYMPSSTQLRKRHTMVPPTRNRHTTTISIGSSDEDPVKIKTEPSDATPSLKRRRSDSDPPSAPLLPVSSLNWPSDFFVVDIVEGFDQCSLARENNESVSKTFTEFFGVPFYRTTFYDNRKRWDEAPDHLKASCKRAGRTEDGLWSTFMAKNRRLRV